MAERAAVRVAGGEDRTLAERLWLMFRHDMSGFRGVLPDADGTFGTERLDRAFTDPDWRPYLLLSGAAPAGLALVRGVDGAERVINAFFVVRGARRGGLGRRAVREITAAHPGRWGVAFQDHNPAAARFWRGVAEELAPGTWREERRVLPEQPELPPSSWLSFTVPPTGPAAASATVPPTGRTAGSPTGPTTPP